MYAARLCLLVLLRIRGFFCANEKKLHKVPEICESWQREDLINQYCEGTSDATASSLFFVALPLFISLINLDFCRLKKKLDKRTDSRIQK